MYDLFPLLILAGLIYIGYQHGKRKRGRPGFGGLFRSHADDVPTTNAERRGEEGEASVDEQLRFALNLLCGSDFYVHKGGLLLRHAPGTAFPTAEVDHLVIAPFGIFVVETKNWSGVITAGDEPGTLVRVSADGQRDVRKSPDAQNRSKVSYLRGLLPGMWPVHGLGVFASPHCTVSPSLPLSLIHVREFGHWLRVKQHAHRASGERPVNVEMAKDAILSNAETSAAALAEHRARVRQE